MKKAKSYSAKFKIVSPKNQTKVKIETRRAPSVCKALSVRKALSVNR